MIRFECPKCDTELEISDKKSGTVIACPECGAKLRVPGGAAKASPNRSSQATRASKPDAPPERPPLRRRSRSDDDVREKRSSSGKVWMFAGGGVAVLIAAGVVVALIVTGSGDKDKKQPQLVSQLKALPQNPGPNDGASEPEPTAPPWTGNGQTNPVTPPPVDTVQSKPSEPAPPPEDDFVPPVRVSRSEKMDAGAIVKRLLKSTAWVVMLTKDGKPMGWGTGTLVDRTNLIVLTNFHVVYRTPDALAIMFADYNSKGEVLGEQLHYRQRGESKQYILGRAVKTDPTRDLALVQLLGPVPKGVLALPFSGKEPSQGDNVHSLGNPGGSGACFVYTPGQVRAVYQKQWLAGDPSTNFILNLNARIIETNSAVNHGDSGGPLVNDRAEQIGVVQGGSATANSMSTFISTKDAGDFISSYFQSIGKTWVQEAPDVDMAGAGPDEIKANIPSIVKALHSKKSETRGRAAEALGQLGPKGQIAVTSLLETLKDDDPLVRKMAAKALDQIGAPDKSDLPQLMRALKDPSVDVRLYVARAVGGLGREGRQAVDALLGAVSDSDVQVRCNAIQSLGITGVDDHDRVFPALFKLVKDSDSTVRASAVTALRSLGKPTAGDLPTLRAALTDPAPEVRAYVASALGEMGSQAGPAVVDLITVLTRDGNKATAIAAASALGQITPDGKKALPHLIKSIQDDDPKLSMACAEAVGKFPPLSAADAGLLTGYLKNPKTHVRASAVAALAQSIEDPREAVASYSEALKDGQKEVRSQAVIALTRLPVSAKDVAVPRLHEAARDADTGLRKSAITALIKFGKDAAPALPALEDALNDPDREIAAQSILAIAAIGPNAQRSQSKLVAVIVDANNKDLREKAFTALSKMGARSVSPLFKLLGDKDKDIRLGAATALGEIGPAATQAVDSAGGLRAHAQGDADPEVKEAAEKAIKKITTR